MFTLMSAAAAVVAHTAPVSGLLAAAVGLKVLSEVSRDDRDHKDDRR